MTARPWAGSKWIIGAMLVTVALSAARAEERPWSRAYRFEVYPMVQVLGGADSSFDDGLIEVESDTALVYGAGMGLNLNDHFNINTELLLGRVELSGGAPGENVELGLTAGFWNLNVDYNILKSRLTPLVTGGLGFVMFNNNGEDINETDFSYNVGVGGRWDINDHIALRVIYRSTWTRLEEADDPSQFNGVAANLIFMFK